MLTEFKIGCRDYIVGLGIVNGIASVVKKTVAVVDITLKQIAGSKRYDRHKNGDNTQYYGFLKEFVQNNRLHK
jgi:hypothetical protein